MPDNKQTASLKATVVETDEPAFKPPAITTVAEDSGTDNAGEEINTDNAVKQIFAILEPEEITDTTYYAPSYSGFYGNVIAPPTVSYSTVPQFEGPKGELVINIETTGAKPWESRLIAIGVMDPNDLEPTTMSFIQETEEDTLWEFADWFNSSIYGSLIGYNVSFDYRFLYALFQKYRIEVPKWKTLYLQDMMQQQKQVKLEYVYGMNPEGKLTDWANYLLGIPEYAPQEQVYAWLQEKNFDEIANFNADKVVKTYYLWVLDKVVSGTIPSTAVAARYYGSEQGTNTSTLGEAAETTQNTISVGCPTCYQTNKMLTTDKTVRCIVCGTPIANPNL